jgi:hypothetical protein
MSPSPLLINTAAASHPPFHHPPPLLSSSCQARQKQEQKRWESNLRSPFSISVPSISRCLLVRSANPSHLVCSAPLPLPSPRRSGAPGGATAGWNWRRRLRVRLPLVHLGFGFSELAAGEVLGPRRLYALDLLAGVRTDVGETRRGGGCPGVCSRFIPCN